VNTCVNHSDRPARKKGFCIPCYGQDYNSKPEHKARAKAIKESPEGRTREKVRKATPEYRAMRDLATEKYRTTPKGKATMLFLAARGTAKTKGLEFSIDHSDVVIPTHCPVFGTPLDCAAGHRAANLPSLDRIDNTKGYIKGNVWVISWRANRIKQDASLEELELLVRAVKRASAFR